MTRRAVLTITSGPNAGDTVSIESGTCRLIGRHLSEAETAFIDRDGNRVLDGAAADILQEHLKDRAPQVGTSPSTSFSASSFERGPDVIFSDDAISRAHAMVFHDGTGVGIIDLASTNGTLVNGKAVNSALVKTGDKITLGGSDLLVKI